MHDSPDTETTEPPLVPGKVPFDKEDTIVGQPASTTYKVCLKQLAEYLLLPISLCPIKDPLISLECRAPEPFHIQWYSGHPGMSMLTLTHKLFCINYIATRILLSGKS